MTSVGEMGRQWKPVSGDDRIFGTDANISQVHVKMSEFGTTSYDFTTMIRPFPSMICQLVLPSIVPNISTDRCRLQVHR